MTICAVDSKIKLREPLHGKRAPNQKNGLKVIMDKYKIKPGNFPALILRMEAADLKQLYSS